MVDPHAQTEPTPPVAGRYRLDAPLDSGGMGIVWKAWDLRLDRVVAVKRILAREAPGSPVRQRFLREQRVLAALAHPHIVPLYDAGEDEDGPWIAMALLEGVTLEKLLDTEGPMAFERALRIGRHVALALHAAHGAGIVHRDLNPRNVFVLDLGAGHEHAVVLDFGIARPVDAANDLTQFGVRIGTPGWMAPEQERGQPATPKTDVFVLGLLISAMLGDLPTPVLAAMTSHDPKVRPTALEVVAALAGPTPRAAAGIRPRRNEGVFWDKVVTVAFDDEDHVHAIDEMGTELHDGATPRRLNPKDRTDVGFAEWDSNALKFVTFPSFPPSVSCVGVSRDRERVFAGSTDGRVLAKSAIGGPEREIAKLDAPIVFVEGFPERRILVGAESPVVVDAAGDIRWTGPPGKSRSAAVDRPGKRFVVAFEEGPLRVWDARTFEEISVLDAEGEKVTCLAWHPDAPLVAAGTEAGRILVWDLAELEVEAA